MYHIQMNFTAQARAARTALQWTQEELAEKSAVSIATIRNIEAGLSVNERTRNKIVTAFDGAGIVFTRYGIEQREENIRVVNSYIDVLDDAAMVLRKGDVIHFHCADDRRSEEPVIEKLREMEKKGIKLRHTIEAGNTCMTTSTDNYRWIDPEYFASSQVMVIYADRVIQHVAEDKDYFLIIKNKSNAKAMSKQFDYWWNKGEKPCPSKDE